jgi:hypothetical protein
MSPLISTVLIVAASAPGIVQAFKIVRTRSATGVGRMRLSGIAAMLLGFAIAAAQLVLAFNAVADAEATSKATELARGISVSTFPCWLGIGLGGTLIVLSAFFRGLFGPPSNSTK